METTTDMKFMQSALDKIGDYLMGETSKKFKKEEAKEAREKPAEEAKEVKLTSKSSVKDVLEKAHEEAEEPEHKGKGKSFEMFFGKK